MSTRSKQHGRGPSISSRASGSRRRWTPGAEPLESRQLLATFLVTNVDDDGVNSLRWALTQANATPNEGGQPDRVEFAIDGTPDQVHKIFIGQTTGAPLPTINEAIAIDGYTQPGSAPNSLADGENAQIRVELDGTLTPFYSEGLRVAGGGSLVRGLAINGFGGYYGGSAIALPSDGNTIVGNFLGTDASGNNLNPAWNGLNFNSVYVTGSGNRVGGTDPGDRNLATGAYNQNIFVQYGERNTIQGNWVGLTADGVRSIAPGPGNGIILYGSNSNTVGGPEAGAGNVVVGQVYDGIQVGGVGNLVQGNLVGTDPTGTIPLGNTLGITARYGQSNTFADNIVVANLSGGIALLYGSSSNVVTSNLVGLTATGADMGNGGPGVWVLDYANTIGGLDPAQGNTIRHNAGDGVLINYGAANAILSNGIRDNGGLGIRLDQGGNGHQPAPVLASGTSTARGTVVTGSVSAPTSPAGSTVLVQFFATAFADPSGAGEGGTYLGSTEITTGSSGSGDFVVTLPGVVPSGWVLTATATDPGRNTSAFSTALPIGPGEFSFTALSTSVKETTGSVAVTVQRTRGSNGEVTVHYATADGTAQAGVDYVATSGTLTFAEGQTSGTILVPLVDNGPNADLFRTFTITLDDATGGATVGYPPTIQVKIVDQSYAYDFAVTNTGDTGPGTLRQAILDANSTPGSNSIGFLLPGPGASEITLQSALPEITEAVLIDGYSQVGASPNTLAQGGDASILVEINGSLVSSTDGLVIRGGGSTVKGLAIGGFVNAIHLIGAGGNTIVGNHVGLTAYGVASPNSQAGVMLEDSPDNRIGSSDPADRNVITASGNGILVYGYGSARAVIQGNYLGTNPSGTGPVYSFNPYYGFLQGNATAIQVTGAGATQIGGDFAGAGNLISANAGDAIRAYGPVDSGGPGVTIQGNLIGTDVTGTRALGNAGSGLILSDMSDNLIGGTSAGARNIISGNGNGGIGFFNRNATRSEIRNNVIGLAIDGVTSLGNAGNGILLGDSGGNAIVGNVVSANGGNGISLNSQIAGDNVVQGNFIGTDSTGTLARGNTGNGIWVVDQYRNQIGGAEPGQGNVISANGGHGIYFYDVFASDNVVQGNSIGTDPGGTIDLGNAGHGILAGVSRNLIGGDSPAAGNKIRFNDQSGVFVYSGIQQISILSNSIDDNGVLGIDLQPGANADQPAPVLRSVVVRDGKTTIRGTLDASAGQTYRVQFFSSPAPDPSGAGEGRVFLGEASVTTDASGHAEFTALLNVVVADGSAVSSTATAASGNTSEFSTSEFVGAGTISFSNDVFAIKEGRGNVVITVTRTRGTSGTLTVRYATANGTARAGVDYVATSGLLTLAEGVTSASFTVPIINNGPGGDLTKTFSVTLSNPSDGAVLGSPSTSQVLILDRANPIDYLVTTTADAGVNSLRQSILDANARIGRDTIGFRLPGDAAQTIRISTALPALTDEVAIDGYTEPGSSPNTASGDNAKILVGVAWAGLGSADGLTITARRSTIRGLSILGFGNGIVLRGGGESIVAGNFLGLNTDGRLDAGNTVAGILVENSGSNRIGGTTPADRNLISGNLGSGVVLSGAGTTLTLVQGNYIGTDRDGSENLANQGDGVAVRENAADNRIGTPGAGNLISGNLGRGVSLLGDRNRVQGNKIGSGRTGTLPVSNGAGGVYVTGAGNLIGGTTEAEGNLISGNYGAGVVFNGTFATGNRVTSNRIGTTADGLSSLTNYGNGVLLTNGASNNVVGQVGVGNLISSNFGSGVRLSGYGTSGNTVQANLVGTNAAGTAALGNSADGVTLEYGASRNTIGGTASGAGNLLSANVFGVFLAGYGTDENLIQGNKIGTNAAGNAAIGNQVDGIQAYYGPARNTIGGSVSGAGNLISGNNVSGIALLYGTTNFTIQGNRIGVDVTGANRLGNGNNGIYVESPGNLIGGSTAGARNVVSSNYRYGIILETTNATANRVLGNYVGTDSTGTAPLNNGITGVAMFFGANRNTIGGTARGSGNVISGNGYYGVEFYGYGTDYNVLVGNIIGADVTGTKYLANTGDGVQAKYGAAYNQIGSTQAGGGNVIAFNSGNGVGTVDAGPGTTILGNSIFLNNALGIDLGNDGVTLAGAPTLASATKKSNDTTVVGQVVGAPGAMYRIQIFSSTYPDPSGHGEGQTLLGTIVVSANSSGVAAFTFRTSSSVAIGAILTATSTDATGATSEFSNGVTLSRAGTVAATSTTTSSPKFATLTDLALESAGGLAVRTIPESVIRDVARSRTRRRPPVV